MKKAEELSGYIKKKTVDIIQNIDRESVDVYAFLKQQFGNTNIKENYLFQFTFRSFYRLDNAGLTQQFKSTYFRILEANRGNSQLSFEKVLNELFLIPNRKGQNTFQFSFVTKMFNMVDDSSPIYDSNVASMFSFSKSSQAGFEKKLIKYLKEFKEISQVYKYILDQKLLLDVMNHFDSTFVNNQLSDIKKMDFIMWSAGKIKNG